FSWVQGSPSSGQVVGQLEAGSQVSVLSTRPLPHTGTQSVSFIPLQPGGQQRSPAVQAVMAACEQVRVQSLMRPAVVSMVHESPSSHVERQAPALPAVMPRSQISPMSTTPLPQTAGQSGSLSWLQPVGQQPSPMAQAVMGEDSQRAE